MPQPNTSHITTQVKESFAALGPELISAKIQQAELFRKSASSGGPDNAFDAFRNLMEEAKIGIRALSARSNVSRRKLQDIFDGKKPLDPETQGKLIAVFEKALPHRFDPDKIALLDEDD